MARVPVVAAALALTLAGCATPPPRITDGPDPADATTAAPAAAYIPVTAGTVDHRPVEPKSWREMNERVAPGAGRPR
ncbi:MAG: hypothetical protein IPK81_09010 [Rhodospirillales bacterium]|nr:MAG: hypothetical protein IPK81_09010 [Rhodospirillales bacterium]